MDLLSERIKTVELFPLAARTQVVGAYGSADIDRRGFGSAVAVLQSAKSSAGSNCTLAVKLQESGALVFGSKNKRTAGAVADLKIRSNTNENIKLGIKFTQATACQVKKVTLSLKKLGTITSGKKITISLETDNNGAPSGTAVAAEASVDVMTDTIGAAHTLTTVVFSRPAALAAGTVYHIAITGDYDVSATNCIAIGVETVVSGGDTATFTTSWQAITATVLALASIEAYEFADITGATFTSVTELADSFQSKGVNLANRKRYVRALATIGGTSASYVCGASLILGDPVNKPA